MCASIVQHVWILIAGLLLWLKDESVHDTVVYSASAACVDSYCRVTSLVKRWKCSWHTGLQCFCSMCGFLFAGLLLWLEDESVHDTVVYSASAPCFLLFPDNSNSDSIIILIQTLLTYWLPASELFCINRLYWQPSLSHHSPPSRTVANCSLH